MPTYTSSPELYIVELAKQSAFATAVTPATVKLMDVSKCSVKPDVKAEARPYLRGSFSPGYTAIVKQIGGGATLEMDLSYEDFPYILDGLFSEATPSGSAAPYTRDYAAPVAAVAAPRISTLFYGASDGVYKLTGAIPTKAVIKGNEEGVATASVDFLGYDVTTATLANLSDRTVNLVMGSDTILYLDAWGGTMGATALSATAFDYELTIDTKRSVMRHMTFKPDGYKQVAWDVSLKLVLEFNSTSKAVLDAVLGSTSVAPVQKQVRIKSTIGSSGTLKLMQFDVCGTVEDSPQVFTDKDGVLTVELMLKGTYHSTFANFLKASNQNAVAALA